VREVSAKAVTSILEALQEAGVDVDGLLTSAAFPVERLRGSGARIDWDDYIRLIERVEPFCGGKITIEEVGTRLLRVPSFQFLQAAARLVISPKQLYTVANLFFAPAMLSNVTVTLQSLPTGRLIIAGEIAPGYRESVAFHRLCHANVITLPTLLDLPASTVEEQMLGGRSARVILIPPASHTIAAKVRRGVRSVFALGDVVRGVIRQQTEIEGSVAALRSSRHELRQLIERLPEGVLIHRGGVVAWANAAMLESLGYATLDEVVGRHVLDFMPVEDRAAIATAMQKSQPNQVSDARLEYRVVRPDGTIRRLEAGTVQHVELEGETARLVVFRDVTEQHRLRERLMMAERVGSLGRLAAGVAHEINNPLAYVHTSIEVALREVSQLATREPKLEEALVRARDGTQRVRAIVRDMQTFTRAERETTTAVDLVAILDSTLALAANAIAPRARIVRRYEPAPYASGTPGRLGQLFLNLVLNAVDAIPEGRPELHEIRVTLTTDAAGRAVVEIGDTGGGIAPGHQADVFDPFFTTKPAGVGTGLGLSICHGIVMQFGGEISFESKQGQGTTFRVALPAATEKPTVEQAAPVRGHGRGRVLIIDDEPEILRGLESLMGDVHDVVTVSSGREALELLRVDRRFDVILTDLMMADVTGMELFDRVRADYPGLEQHIVFMTGGAFTKGSHNLLANVPNRRLDKPFDADELLRTVDELVFAATARTSAGGA
jgi:two-component system, cell cycle sensor histidine kinase and response regulator CckA